jgi:hypothetical protein
MPLEPPVISTCFPAKCRAGFATKPNLSPKD